MAYDINVIMASEFYKRAVQVAYHTIAIGGNKAINDTCGSIIEEAIESVYLILGEVKDINSKLRYKMAKDIVLDQLRKTTENIVANCIDSI